MCLRQAADSCTAHRIAGEGGTPLGNPAYSYSAGTAPNDVHLVLVPQPELVWSSWTRYVNAIIFIQRYLEYKELHFTLLWDLPAGQVRVVGVGRMWGGLGDGTD